MPPTPRATSSGSHIAEIREVLGEKASLTSEELYQQIVRNPDDDAPRLAYADAIAARLPERAEFVRLQITRFHDEATRKVERGAPGAREGFLRRLHGQAWGQQIAPYARAFRADAPFQGYEFERGFVALLRTEPDMVADMGDELFAMAPIQHLDLTPEGPFIPALTAPCLGRMRSLGFDHLGLGDEDAIALAERGHLDRCEWLDLTGNRITRRGTRALLANPVIRQIPMVLLSFNPGDPGVRVSHDPTVGMIVEGLPPLGEEAEAQYGRIPWLYLTRHAVPDRYHARAVKTVS